MRILSYRQQFVADHSSTSYLFYSPKPLSKEARATVSKLSSHVDVGAHTSEITYNGEFADLGDARRKKFLEHYETEVRESYDWWDISIMLDRARVPPDELKPVPGDEDEEEEEIEGEASLTFEKFGDRIRLLLEGCHLDYDACVREFGQGNLLNDLAEFAIDIRDELYTGKTDALKVMRTYCRENKVIKRQDLSSPVAKKLTAMLEPI